VRTQGPHHDARALRRRLAHGERRGVAGRGSCAEAAADEVCARDASLGLVHLAAEGALDVRGLREQEEFVDGGEVDGVAGGRLVVSGVGSAI
jgi:hypothetical protein